MTLAQTPQPVAGLARCVWAALALLVCMAGASNAQDRGISAAEQKVFLDDQLKGVRAPSVLRYAFRRSGKPEESFEDRVVLRIKPAGRDSRSADVSYLTGQRQVTLPALDDVKANPVILYFLEQDVRDMHRRLGGSENYFRRRIRLALAEGAEMRSVSVRVAGKDVTATEVVLQPFTQDPMQARLGASAGKRYVFTLSDQVPGGVVELRTRVEAEAGSPPLEDLLSFEKVES